MNRRAFLQAIAAGTYSIALPAMPAIGSEARYWKYTIRNVEMVPSGAFGSVIRGLAILDDRPDVCAHWAFLVDTDRYSVDEAMNTIEQEMQMKLEQHFRDKLERES